MTANKKFWMAAAFLILAAGAHATAGQPRFYLSTERVFSPSEENIHVRLEARGVPHVDFRVYRVENPEAFFTGQQDLHRVELGNAPKRASALDVMREVWRASASNLLELARSRMTDKARTTGREAYPQAVEKVRQESETVPPPSSVVPLLKGHELVDMWREYISGAEGRWSYLDVDVNPRRPGVYLVEGVYGHEVGYTVVIVSRIVMLTRQSADGFLVYAVDPDLGKPVQDVHVRVLSGEQEVGRGTTDERGVWTKSIHTARSLTVFAHKDGEFALADPTYYPANLFQRKVYITTERPVYRPGQEVFFKGVIRAYRDESYEIEDAIGKVKVAAVDPNGQNVYKTELTVSDSGSFDGRLELFDNAAMGTYRLVATVKGEEYGGEFKVKAYQKPEYRVGITTPRPAYVSGAKVEATVQANYYFGPPLPGAKVKISVYRTRFYVPWWIDADYAWYYADAEYRNTMRETIVEREERLDQKGSFTFSFETLQDSLDYTYGIEAVVIDAAGNSVAGHKAVRVTQAQFRLALLPAHLLFSPGGEVQVELTSEDYGGRAVQADVQVDVSARVGSEPGKERVEQVLSRKVHTGSAGKARIAFEPSRGGVYRVEARATDERGNRVEAFTLVYVTDGGGDIPYAPDQLEIIADRRSYHVGDDARFLLLTPHPDTHLLVTVEGGRLYRHRVIRAHGYSAIFETPIEEAQSPNFMVRVATVFDRALYERSLDVVVPPRDKLLEVTVTADKQEVRPGDKITFTVAVRDRLGKPVSGAEVALGIVDEAIYGISPEIVIPISRFFYHRKRNNVRSTCSLAFRFYGYGQDLKDRMASLTIREAVVPGSFKALASQEIRKEFKDTLHWAPMLTTGDDGRASVEVTAPDNLTAWRATARVITADTRVAQGTGTVRVAKPVVLRIAAPAYLVERDQTTLGLLVHNYTGEKKVFELELDTEKSLLEIEGEAGKVEVAPGGIGVARLALHARKPGTAVLRARARAGELGDALQRDLVVRPYGMEQVLLAGGVLDDQHPRAEASLRVPPGAAPESVRADVTLSTGIVPALLASLDYLTGYPYGCTEQTMSRFVPDLVVARVLDDLGMKNEKLQEALPRYIHAGLAHLAQLQHQDGGWGWWSNDPTDPFMTAYVVHGLAMADRMKWPVDKDMYKRGVDRLKALARSNRLNANQRAYLLHSLALAGVKYESMLDKLSRDGSLSEYGKALCAMALFELGKRETALQLASRIDLAVHTGANGSWWGRQNGPGWEQDPVESTAAALRTLIHVKPDSSNIADAVRWLMAVREGDHWASTRDTAMAVYALADYLKRSGGQAYDAKVSLRLNGKEQPSRSFGGDDVLAPSVAALDSAPASIGKNTIELEREGDGILFYNASVRFFGRQEKIAAQGSRFRITRDFFALEKKFDGERWRFSTRPLVEPVESGDEILVVLEIEASQEADYIMVEDPMPAGVQPVERDRGYDIPGTELRQPRLHRSFHDQHTAFFISNLRRGKRRLGYLVRATLPGNYQIMPARVVPMYDPQLAGNSSNARLTVVE